MTIRSEKDLKSLEKIGKIVSIARDEMIKAVRPDITTKELDRIGEFVLSSYGAKSAPKYEYDFPGHTCISVNNQAAHGIPGLRRLKAGDVVNIDVSAALDGYFADTGATIALNVCQEKQKLCDCSQMALAKGIDKARAGSKINQIGKAIYQEAKDNGFTVIKNLAGHGIGKRLHEEPSHILNYYDKRDNRILHRGLVLAVETFLSTGAEYVIEGRDGWTLRTPDRSLVAQFEHTIIVTENEPIIVTA
ncbi:type I methionyl aminopeptidase [Sinanaerobacter chloroacetimidivorans]|uniref:Methionine aminopeptidase n=1 Tax=Sinanaerobacter chloroacetimidivorans TaxID=2818044 RepID=A0A8J7W5R6_9FIRM|nr:type I methionyl aminopeptidase [Sinanaerobacter chloroacetimidivorans]MBR0599435.1 type I methionyl aminopeptidase [Sinanaerobacter chloroacetimidivorans]